MPSITSLHPAKASSPGGKHICTPHQDSRPFRHYRVFALEDTGSQGAWALCLPQPLQSASCSFPICKTEAQVEQDPGRPGLILRLKAESSSGGKGLPIDLGVTKQLSKEHPSCPTYSWEWTLCIECKDTQGQSACVCDCRVPVCVTACDWAPQMQLSGPNPLALWHFCSGVEDYTFLKLLGSDTMLSYSLENSEPPASQACNLPWSHSLVLKCNTQSCLPHMMPVSLR